MARMMCYRMSLEGGWMQSGEFWAGEYIPTRTTLVKAIRWCFGSKGHGGRYVVYTTEVE